MMSLRPVLVALALLACALPAAAQEGTTGSSTTAPPQDSSPPSDGNATAPPPDGNATGAPGNGTSDGNATAPAPPFAGSFAGNHLAFEAARDGIHNVSVDGRPVVAAILFTPPLDPSSMRVEGADVRVEGPFGSFEASDGAAEFRAKSSGALAFRLAAGVSAASPAAPQEQAEGRYAILGPDGLLGHVIGTGIVLAENETVILAPDARFEPHVATPAPLAPEIARAVDEGQIGGQVVVHSGADGPAAVPITREGVNLTVTSAVGHVLATVEGSGEGTALLFSVDKAILQGDLVVRFDGQPILAAADLADVLDARADEAAEYLVLVGANTTQVLVAVPHFSVHTIELASAGPAAVLEPFAQGSPWAFAGAAAVAAAFVAVTSWRRARQH